MALSTPSLYDMLSPDKALDPNKQSVTKLSDKLGMSQPPITPVSTAMVGANKDQAKMAGTPAQIQGLTNQPAQDYDTAKREEQARTIKTPAEIAQEQHAATSIAAMGTLGQTVLAATQNVMSGATTATAPIVNAEWMKTLPAEQQTAALPAFDAYTKAQALPANDPSREEAINRAIEGIEAVVGKDKLGEMILSSGDPAAMGSWIAKQTPDVITVGMLDAAKPGFLTGLVGPNTAFKDMDELATELGVAPDKINSMTLKQLEDKTSEIVKKGQDSTTQLRSVLNDPSVSATDRANARAALRDAGATDIAATEQEITDFATNIKDAGNVEINGHTVDMLTALDDDVISDAINHYLDGDIEAGDALPQGIKAYVDSNREVFDKMARDAAASEKGWQEIKAGSDTVASTLKDAEGNPLADNIVKQLYDSMGIDTSAPDWKNIYTKGKLDKINGNPIISLLGSLNAPKDATAKKAVIDSINSLVTSGVKLSDLNSFSKEELTNLGLGDPSSSNWKQISDLLIKRNSILNDNADPASLLSSPDMNPEQNQANRAVSVLFGQPYSSKLDSIDLNHDGKITGDEIKNAVKDVRFVFDVMKPNTDTAPLWKQLGPFEVGFKDAASDGAITDGDITKVVSSNPATVDITNIERLLLAMPDKREAIKAGAGSVILGRLAAWDPGKLSDPSAATSWFDGHNAHLRAQFFKDQLLQEAAKNKSIPGFPDSQYTSMLAKLDALIAAPVPELKVDMSDMPNYGSSLKNGISVSGSGEH